MKLRSAIPAETEMKSEDSAKAGQLPIDPETKTRSQESKRKSRSPVVQDRDAILKLELEMIQERLRQRDGEINILLRMLKQERKRADRAEGALSVAGVPVRTVSPVSPDRLSPVRLSRNASVPSSVTSNATSTTTPLSQGRGDETGRSADRVRGSDGVRERGKMDARQSGAPASAASQNGSEEWQTTLKEG